MKKLLILSFLISVGCARSHFPSHVGPVGPQGPKGSSGGSGLNSLILLEDVVVLKAVCKSKKAVVVKVGLDMDMDNVLNSSEVTQSTTICSY